MSDTADSVKIDRSFDAAPSAVWDQWTTSENFAGWYGPPGAKIPVAEMDVQVGGSRKICMEMETPDGPMQMWFVGEYVEIGDGDRLVYTECMGDADGNATSPATTVVVELAEAPGGGTSMSMTHEGVPADSPGAMGWQMAIEKLADRLA